ncbi:MAG: GyrI-like domain-containing protein [Pseudorhodoplanes sp.]|nr:GyrI-like domain-containing protein [Pseudorhodoplanes sp.]
MFPALRLSIVAAALAALLPFAALSQTPPAPLQPGDAFGEAVQLAERPIIYLEGQANWDAAYDTIVEALRTVHSYLDRAGIKPAGNAMTIYIGADDTGFQFRVGVPIAEAPADPPRGDLALGKTPAGKAYRFLHRGSYDAMDTTYEAITNYLDEKNIEAQDIFIEEYETDLRSTPDDKLTIVITVPVK